MIATGAHASAAAIPATPRRPSPARTAPSICEWRSDSNGRSVAAPSEHRQVPLELPAADLDPVLLPLLALQLDVALEDVVAERLADELGAGEDLDRLAQGLRQLHDPARLALVVGEVVEVS